MVLGIILCGIIQCVYLMVSIIILAKTPITLAILAFIIAHIFFIFILSFASTIMNGCFIARARLFRYRGYVGLGFSIAANVLCIVLAVFLLLIRQGVIVFDYHFMSDNYAVMRCLL